MSESPNSHAAFEPTRWSIVLRARGEGAIAEKALADLCQTYWFPLYAFGRRAGSSAADAEDLVQGFFAYVVRKDLFAAADAQKGKLRTFLLTAFRRYRRDEYVKANAVKRGGGSVVSFDASEAENWYAEEEQDGETPETMFDRQWALNVLDRAVEKLEQDAAKRKKSAEFEALRAFLTGVPETEDYEQIAEALQMKVNAIRVAIHRLRAKFSAALREVVRDTHFDDTDVDEEMRHLLNVLS
ncbi:MAG: RNA polymerase sigma factor (sigma-70 family) [Verrucomicrobiales bacterium]|jgi:RNA polymerase sigma factor (sigma-70 family)